MTPTRSSERHSKTSSSSAKTGRSKITEELLALGAQIVEDLNLKAERDILSLWMAHHLAAKLAAFGGAVGAERERQGSDLYDAILKFWKHRTNLPHGIRPFQNHEAVLRSLENLDPQRAGPFYFNSDFFIQASGNSNDPKVKAWIDTALDIDRAARALISFCISVAAENAGKPKKAWMDAAKIHASDAIDVRVAIRLAKSGDLVNDKVVDLNKDERNHLTAMRDRMNALVKSSSDFSTYLDARIKALPPKLVKLPKGEKTVRGRASSARSPSGAKTKC